MAGTSVGSLSTDCTRVCEDRVMKPKTVYMLLAIAGAAIPLLAFIPWELEHGLNLQLLIAELFANRISTFFGLDVVVSAVVVLAFALIERSRIGLRLWYMPLLGMAFVGVSFGLPLLLYLREAAIERSPAARPVHQ